jgi:hypothetical protein
MCRMSIKSWGYSPQATKDRVWNDLPRHCRRWVFSSLYQAYGGEIGLSIKIKRRFHWSNKSTTWKERQNDQHSGEYSSL